MQYGYSVQSKILYVPERAAGCLRRFLEIDVFCALGLIRGTLWLFTKYYLTEHRSLWIIYTRLSTFQISSELLIADSRVLVIPVPQC